MAFFCPGRGRKGTLVWSSGRKNIWYLNLIHFNNPSYTCNFQSKREKLEKKHKKDKTNNRKKRGEMKLTCYNVEISILLLVVRVLRVLRWMVLLGWGCLDSFIFLWERNVPISMQLRNVLWQIRIIIDTSLQNSEWVPNTIWKIIFIIIIIPTIDICKMFSPWQSHAHQLAHRPRHHLCHFPSHA